MNPVQLSLLEESPYVGYAYSYPHKTAYRAFEPPLPLATLWRNEPRGGLFLYLHIPFCEFRCGFFIGKVEILESRFNRLFDVLEEFHRRTQLLWI